MKVLATGGCGFVGSNLVALLRAHGYKVEVADIRDKASPVDLLHPGSFAGRVERFEPDLVVHLAAKVGRLFGEADIRDTIRSNVEMTGAVAKVCGDVGVRLVYVSSSEVYGDQRHVRVSESGPFSLPHNAYGLSKRQGEEFCRLYVPDDRLTVVRLSMPYGPGVAPGRGRAALPNILWQAHTRQPIPIHRGAERSWCWIGDTVEAMRLLVRYGYHGDWNVGRDDDPRLLRDLAALACEMTGAPTSLIEDVDPPAAQTVVKRLSTDKLFDIGWQPKVDVEEGMAMTLEWVRRFDADGRMVRSAAAA